MKRRNFLKSLAVAVAMAPAIIAPPKKTRVNPDGSINLPWKSNSYDKVIGHGKFSEKGLQIPVFSRDKDGSWSQKPCPEYAGTGGEWVLRNG